MMVACHWNMLSPVGPAEQDEGGSRPRSTNSCKQSANRIRSCARTTVKKTASEAVRFSANTAKRHRGIECPSGVATAHAGNVGHTTPNTRVAAASDGMAKPKDTESTHLVNAFEGH